MVMAYTPQEHLNYIWMPEYNETVQGLRKNHIVYFMQSFGGYVWRKHIWAIDYY